MSKSFMRPTAELRNRYVGLLWAGTIVAAWCLSAVSLFWLPVHKLPIPAIAGAVLLRTFLHTGLFITAHDAMHRSVCTTNHRLNDLVGRLAVALYAFLPYRELLVKHQQHHRAPATASDPDYHDGRHTGFGQWYLNFMQEYMAGEHAVRQLVALALLCVGCLWLLAVPAINLLLFWLLPLVLSSVQLFYFGTYLPHRRPHGGYHNRHRATSNRLCTFWSFISCYHFGYHWEHHEYPQVPWYHLPSLLGAAPRQQSAARS
ncbi:fatty acid desaturase [Gloeobacter kilaueensis]|nr:fatty acid desaturase [Gloeobacter kilaueensis]